MRDLKFKVWDKVFKKIYKPQAISFDRQTSLPFAVSLPNKSWEPIAKFELLLWTGLTDQNGLDVYEGDIIQIESFVYEVVWNQTDAVFELVHGANYSKISIKEVHSGNIVGSIYQ